MRFSPKHLMYTLAALSTNVFATDQSNLGTQISLISTSFMTEPNINTIGTGITLVGLGIALFKVIQVMFGGSSWAEHAKAIFGGLIVAILGTKLWTILVALNAVEATV